MLEITIESAPKKVTYHRVTPYRTEEEQARWEAKKRKVKINEK